MEQRPKTEHERQIGRAYYRDFAPAIVGYTVATFAIAFLVDFETAGWWKYIAAMVPVVPALWAVRAIGRHLSRIDEMHQMNLLVALAAGFGVAMVAALTIGFLSIAGLDVNPWGPWLIFGIGMTAWTLTAIRRAKLA